MTSDIDDRHTLLDGEDDLPPIEDQPCHEYFVIRQEVSLEVNFHEKRLSGTTDIILAIFNDKLEHVYVDAANCHVDTKHITVTDVRPDLEAPGGIVDLQKRRVHAEMRDPYEKLAIPKNWNMTSEHHDVRRMRARGLFHSRKNDVPAEAREYAGSTPAYGSLKVNLKGRDANRPRVIVRTSTMHADNPTSPGTKQYKITIPFSTKGPRDGVHFVGVDPLDHRYTHMYTRHSVQPGTASCIFPCLDDHGAYGDWKISIKYPKTLGDALRKPLASHSNGSENAAKTSHGDSDKAGDLAEEDKLREMTVVCSGFLQEEMTDPKDDKKKIMTFEPEKKTSVQKLGFAVGPFEHVDLSSEFRSEEDEIKLGLSALRVHGYCLPHRADWVRNSCVALTWAADHFSYTFAKYPFGNFKLCFLEDMVDETVPLYSMAFISNRLLFPEGIIDTEVEVTRKLVYTLAYQWSGINLIPNTRNDLWLVVGIAHFLTELFMKKICGNNEHRFRMKTLSDQLVETDIERPSLYDLGPHVHLGQFETDFMNLKAPLVFFILDKRMAKASGGHGLQRMLAKYLTKVQIDSGDKPATLKTEDFQIRCEKAARVRLESFWNQWVYGSGTPRFDVKAKFNKKRLCVELTLNQIQHQVVKKPELKKEDFLQAIKERRADVPLGDVQPLFTGPMTIRIHEADGTPYEHILEIREDATRSTKFEIPYNTKYKRLKRTRRMKEKHVGNANLEPTGDGAEDALLYCLGDVLQTPEEQKQWELMDWDPETERKMDQESYEWIRIDADFEWVAAMKHTLEPYMYVSQLQQDRDVVAQQDAMLFFSQTNLHPIASGFMVRTLMDKRYFHGIRTMAAEALPRQANIKDLPMLGLRQLMMAYREMFCYDDTSQPHPNNFSDKQQYKVRCAVIRAIASVRDSNTHRCPLEARQFVLDQLLFNNNEDNPYSDHHWIATLVEAVATSLIPSKKDEWLERQLKTQQNEGERAFLGSALDQIERVLRRDEWTNSYQNVWTIAGLDAKQRLMKAEVIPMSYIDFGQYLLDGTADPIRIKCFEALIDLGAITDSAVFSLLLFTISSDRSPFVRDRLIQAVSRGLAAIAFGEHAKPAKEDEPMDMDDPLLIVQDTEKEVAARQEMFARKQNLDSALKALRKEITETYATDQRHYSMAMRKALDHAGLGRMEVESLLDIAAMMFEEAGSWVVTLKLPKGWKVKRSLDQLSDRLMMTFQSFYKTKPKEPIAPPPLPPPARPSEPPRPTAPQRTGSIKINTKGSGTPRPSVSGPSTDSSSANKASPTPRQPSFSQPKPSVDTPLHTIKRPVPGGEENSTAKRARTETPRATEANGERRKSSIVTLKITDTKRLSMTLGEQSPTPKRTSLPSVVPKTEKEPTPEGVPEGIKPARKPLPTGDSARKPLPGSSTSPPAPAPAPAPQRMSISTNVASSSPAPAAKAGSATPSTPAGGRPKIKIVRKTNPNSQNSGSPPAP